MRLPKFPFVIMLRKRFRIFLAEHDAETYKLGYEEGAQFGLDMKAEQKSKRKAITKPRKGRP